MNVVSLFAGCGGLDLGFRKAGFNVIWANEYDTAIHETYRFNHPDTILNTSDIRSIKGSDIPECDGIIGGPPCQAWSEGGKRLGIKDPRGLLFFDYIRIVKEKRPKFFVIENVQGILDEEHQESLSLFLKLLTNAGYKITYELLNAADYKVPQDRYRVFFIGIRNDFKSEYTFPDAVCKTPITLNQAIGDITEIPRFFKDEIIKEEHPKRLNHDVFVGSYDAKYMSRNRVRSWNDTSFTIQAQARNIPQHPQAPMMTFISSSQRIFAKGYEHLYRRLSVRECARIQTFPDNFRFIYTDIKDGYKMVGNAVPPRLAWFLAMQIKKFFTNETGFQVSNEIKSVVRHIPIIKLVEQYGNTLKENSFIENVMNFDYTKNVLVSLVKLDTISYYNNQSAQIYYTGKTFPSNIAINELYYFVPYIKGKGVRDLYFIKKVRIGTKQEVHPECKDNSFRLVFEIEFVKQLFNNYIPIHLNIWRTFTQMCLEKLLKINEKVN